MLEYQLSLRLLVASAGVCALAAVAGALGAVRRAAALPPAEAMRPEPPARYSQGPLERAGLGSVLSAGGRMILRNLERTPMRSLLSSVGVAFSVAILLIGMFLLHGMQYMMDSSFARCNAKTSRCPSTKPFRRRRDTTWLGWKG